MNNLHLDGKVPVVLMRNWRERLRVHNPSPYTVQAGARREFCPNSSAIMRKQPLDCSASHGH